MAYNNYAPVIGLGSFAGLMFEIAALTGFKVALIPGMIAVLVSIHYTVNSATRR